MCNVFEKWKPERVLSLEYEEREKIASPREGLTRCLEVVSTHLFEPRAS
jgi:hypothetical protein